MGCSAKTEQIFNSFWHYGSQIAKNFGPTATGKILHIINPNLFMVWDDAIRLHYWILNNNIIDSGRGYAIFLVETKEIAAQVVNEFIARHGEPDLGFGFIKD